MMHAYGNGELLARDVMMYHDGNGHHALKHYAKIQLLDIYVLLYMYWLNMDSTNSHFHPRKEVKGDNEK